MITIRAKTEGAEAIVAKFRAVMADAGAAFDQPVDTAAWKVYALLVAATPKGYTGDTRRKWQVAAPQLGQRIVSNPSKVMTFLEGGTGLTTGGWIYPKTKLVLYVPLTAAAALGGWSKDLVFGKDYLLAKRVRGIKAMNIVAGIKPKAQQILVAEMKAWLAKRLSS